MLEAKRVALGRWRARVQHDLLAAETLLAQSPEAADVICYHCQ
jgi:hypothetical protein